MKTILASAMISIANIQASETEAIAAVLIGEAGGEGRVAMEAVAEVIYNRAKWTGKERLEIILQPGQFECIGRLGHRGLEKLIRLARGHTEWPAALQIAASRPTNHTQGATYLSERDIWPRWAPPTCLSISIGDLRFYRLPFPVQKITPKKTKARKHQ